MKGQIYFSEANSSTTIGDLKSLCGKLKCTHYFKKASWFLCQHIEWERSIPVNEYVSFIFINKEYIEHWLEEYEQAYQDVWHAQSLIEDYRNDDFDQASLLEAKEVYSDLLSTFNFDKKTLVAYLVPAQDMLDFQL